MIRTVHLVFTTGKDLDILDITGKVQEEIRRSGMKEGVVTVFAKGSTASVSTMEFEPNLVKDFSTVLERVAPSNQEYEHHQTWGDENGKSHCRSTLMGPSIAVPFQDRKLLLGTWQQLVLLDFDVPAREREIILTMMGE